MSALKREHKLYKAIESAAHTHLKVHAIYEPDGDGAFGDCYCAAVDLFEEGMTFRVYFSLTENHDICVKHVERWHFG